MTATQKVAILVVLAMLVAASLSVLVTARKAPSVAPIAPVPATDASGLVTVHVTGRVNQPGVYRLPASARVQDALLVAGGVAPDGDANAMNLAAGLTDGMRLSVPAASTPAPTTEAMPPAMSAPTAASSPASPPLSPQTSGSQPSTVAQGTTPPGSGAPSHRGRAAGKPVPAVGGAPISLSAASQQELQALPGIGPMRAGAIIAYRTQHGGFRSVDELANISGFGPKLLERIRPYIVP
jgi:competence protein ComEA